jgi:excisionase family DNA binding protein
MPAIADDSQTFLSPEQVAGVLGVSRSWVYQHKDELPFVRLGAGPKSVLRMDRGDLKAYLLREQGESRCAARVRSV